MLRATRRKGWLLALTCGVLVLTACAVPALILWVIPYADAAVCVPRAAQSAGVAPSYQAIEQYIVDNTANGLSRAQVTTALQKLGPLQIRSDQSVSDETVDDIWINLCIDPLNNVEIAVAYSGNGLVVWSKFLNHIS